MLTFGRVRKTHRGSERRCGSTRTHRGARRAGPGRPGGTSRSTWSGVRQLGRRRRHPCRARDLQRCQLRGGMRSRRNRHLGLVRRRQEHDEFPHRKVGDLPRRARPREQPPDCRMRQIPGALIRQATCRQAILRHANASTGQAHAHQAGSATSFKCLKTLERVKGIEPSSSAWKAVALPLSYTRIGFGGGGRTRTYEGISQRIYSPPPLPLGTLPRRARN
jgi:hypothetical protein